VSDLPENWLSLPLGEVIQTQKGKKPYDLGEKSEIRTVAYINIKAFETKEILEYAPEQEVHACEPKDVLLVWDGARSGLSGRGVNGYVGSTLARVRSDLVDADYLYYFFESIYSFLNTQTKGVGIPHINPVVLNSIDFFLPPKAEQSRIVEKLEELLSDLDDGISELKTAQIKLGQYRQSLLKSAVDGSLTTEWRKQNSNKISETGGQLLARTLKERRQHWEKQKLAEFAAKDKTPPKNWQAKYPEPVVPDTSELPELPKDWVWASLSQIGWLDRGRSKHRPRNASHLYGGDYPFVQTGDIRSVDTYITSSSKMYSEMGLEQSKLWPKGTMCITIAANIGETAILGFDACFPDSVVGFLPVNDELSVEYIEFLFRTIKDQLEKEAPATAQKNINLAILSKVVLPLAPLPEQKEIINVLQSGLRETTDKESSIFEAFKQLESQRKNILKDAFTGKLVPQNPNDEPASVLLEKIKAERAEQAKQPKPKRTKRKPRAMKKMDSNTLKIWVKELKQETFTFAELQKAFSGDYEELKEALFSLLAEPNSVIEQIFDNKIGVLFQRTTG